MRKQYGVLYIETFFNAFNFLHGEMLNLLCNVIIEWALEFRH